MRLPCLFFACWGLFHSAAAQSIKRKSDYYVLADSSTRHPATINLVESDKIEIKEPSGKKHALRAGSLERFQSKGHRYYTVSNFETNPGKPTSRVRYGFAELLDSGQVVMLLRYDYSNTKLMVTGGSGMLLPGIGSGTSSLYLVRLAASSQATAVPANGPQFRAALQPYLANRPDLLAFLLNKSYSVADLPNIVRALNLNLPFVKTTLPLEVD